MCEKVKCCTNVLLLIFEKHQVSSKLLLSKGVNVKNKHLLAAFHCKKERVPLMY